MPLWLLAVLVVVGLGAVWAALRALGFDAEARLASDEAARRAWLREHPGDAVLEVLRASDDRAALIRTGRGWGLVWVMGLGTASRALDGAEVRPAAEGLCIALGDFAAPAVEVALAPPARTRWLTILQQEATCPRT